MDEKFFSVFSTVLLKRKRQHSRFQLSAYTGALTGNEDAFSPVDFLRPARSPKCLLVVLAAGLGCPSAPAEARMTSVSFWLQTFRVDQVKSSENRLF